MTVPFNVNATGDMATPWNFPAALYLLIVTFAVVGGHLLLLAVSLCRIPVHPSYEVRFQALELRITAFLPVFAILTTIAAFWPWISIEIDVALAVAEGYIILMFFALFTGRGWTGVKGVSYPDALMESPASSLPAPCLSSFANGRSAISSWRNMCAQFIVVKTLMMLITLGLARRNGGIAPAGASAVLRAVSTVSLILALYALIRVYRGSSNAPGEPFKGHYLVTKFMIVKILFTFIVVNNLVLKNLLVAQTIPINAWLCESFIWSASPLNREYCETRVLSVIFLFETFIVAAFAYVWFRPRSPAQIAEADGVNPATDLPAKAMMAPKMTLIFYMIYPFDLHQFWEGNVGGGAASSTVALADPRF